MPRTIDPWEHLISNALPLAPLLTRIWMTTNAFLEDMTIGSSSRFIPGPHSRDHAVYRMENVGFPARIGSLSTYADGHPAEDIAFFHRMVDSGDGGLDYVALAMTFIPPLCFGIGIESSKNAVP